MKGASLTQNNNAFNTDVERPQSQLANYKEGEEKNRALSANVETLRHVIAGELDLKNGFPPQIAEAMIEKAEVYASENKNEIDLRIHFKVLFESENYRIKRHRGKISNCYRQHT